MPLHKFRKELAMKLIENDEGTEDTGEEGGDRNGSKRRRVHQNEHLLVTAPAYAHEYMHGTWKKHPTSRYPEKTCKTRKCKNRVRTYCSCHPGMWMCVQCWGNHRECVGESNTSVCEISHPPTTHKTMVSGGYVFQGLKRIQTPKLSQKNSLAFGKSRDIQKQRNYLGEGYIRLFSKMCEISHFRCDTTV